MRALPFDDASFASVVAVQSIEHVPDPERAVAEAARVLEPDGAAVFVTPNRLTLGRPDEIIDPYHYVEFDPDELRRSLRASRSARSSCAACSAPTPTWSCSGEERATLDRLLRLDPLRLRRLVPRAIRQSLYDRLLRHYRPDADPRAEAIGADDFELRSDHLEESLDVCARVPLPAGPRPHRSVGFAGD